MSEHIEETKRIFNKLVQEKISFIILRNYEFLDGARPHPGECDLIVAPEHIERLKTFFLNQKYFFKYLPKHYIFSLITPTLNITFDFELGSTHSLGIPVLSFNTLLKYSQKKEGFLCLTNEGLAAHLIFHCLINKKEIKPSHRVTLENTLVKSNKETLFSLLNHSITKKISQKILKSITNKKYIELNNKRFPLLCNILIKNPSKTSSFLSFIWFRIIQRVHFPGKYFGKGITIALIGLDGTGKSTISASLNNIFKNLGYKTHIVYMGRIRGHAIPLDKVAKKAGISKIQKDKKKKPNILYLLARDFVYCLDMFFRYIKFILPYKMKNYVVICDRYSYDLYLDKNQKSISRFLLKYLYPKANSLIFLTLPEEEIIKRKNEYSKEKRQFLLSRWEEVVKDFQAYTVVSNELQTNTWDIYNETIKKCWEK